MKFRPTFWPTVISIPAFVVLLGLGTWQVQRLHWKEQLIAERTARTTAAPIALPAAGQALPAGKLDDLDFRRATVQGEFRHDQEMYLAARTMEGSVGYQIVTPLQLADGSVALVNRGWVPDTRKDPAKRAAGQVAGTVTVDGVIRVPGVQHWLQPDNEPARNIWFWSDLPAMAAHAGIPAEKLVPVFLEAGPAPNPGGLPIGGQTHINLPNDHLQYAIIWFALAVGLAAIYVRYHTQRDGAAAASTKQVQR
ncbi:MAG TPA: SURF1 family protein [Methylomirabilota bacterium]|nr:SURF1 family protein [Methylomirabilota bacterium]